jgi:hypothetical protein
VANAPRGGEEPREPTEEELRIIEEVKRGDFSTLQKHWDDFMTAKVSPKEEDDDDDDDEDDEEEEEEEGEPEEEEEE